MLTIRRHLATAASFIALAACASTPEDETTKLLADAEEAVDAAQEAVEDAPGAPDLDTEEIALLKESVFVAAAIPNDVPGDFTGCYADAEACFVGGNKVDAAVRYEPQSGRFWFLDPGSGNTYFANGDMRTENGFRAIMAKAAAPEPVLAMASAPAPNAEPAAAEPTATAPVPELKPEPAVAPEGEVQPEVSLPAPEDDQD
ncbi:MAG: hypothetical protein AAF830_02140 [Pseudomonadota bacterium]